MGILQTADKGGLCRNLYFSHNAHSHLRQTKESLPFIITFGLHGQNFGDLRIKHQSNEIY